MTATFAERLRGGERLLGGGVSTSPVAAEILGDCGFDWLFVDAETLPLSMPDIQHTIRAAQACGVAAVVRLNTDQPGDIRQVLDMGAAGVVIPLVKSVAQARRIVGAAKYPPLGERGMAAGRAQAYGAKLKEYLARANTETAIIVMVEDAEGLAQVGGDRRFRGSGWHICRPG